MELFHFFLLPQQRDFIGVLVNAVPKCPKYVIEKLVGFRKHLLTLANDPGSALWIDTGVSLDDNDADPSSMQTVSSQAVNLSLRQMLRISRYVSSMHTVNVLSPLRCFQTSSSLRGDFIT